jgi:hypothetical protein
LGLPKVMLMSYIDTENDKPVLAEANNEGFEF